MIPASASTVSLLYETAQTSNFAVEIEYAPKVLDSASISFVATASAVAAGDAILASASSEPCSTKKQAKQIACAKLYALLAPSSSSPLAAPTPTIVKHEPVKLEPANDAADEGLALASAKNYRAMLNELLQSRGEPLPDFGFDTPKEGTWTCVFVLRGKVVSGFGPSKAAAKESAAKIGFEQMTKRSHSF